MPVCGSCRPGVAQHAYFDSLHDLDIWAANSSGNFGGPGVLMYHERSDSIEASSSGHGGKLLVSTVFLSLPGDLTDVVSKVCHDYKVRSHIKTHLEMTRSLKL